MSRPLSPSFLLLCVLGWITVAQSGPSTAVAQPFETLSPQAATRIGLTSSWQRHLGIPGGVAQLVDAQIHVDSTRIRTVVEVVADGEVLLRIPADQANQYGQPIGLEEAQRLARLEVYKLKRRGIAATVGEIQVPEVRLYALGSDGTLEARDAETGRVLWTERHGDARLPYLPMAINDRFVIFVNGAELHVVDALTGTPVATRAFHAVPLQGPAIVGDYVMAVCTDRRVEGFRLDNFEGDRFTATVAGLPMAAPVTSPGSSRMMWPTDSGFVYALDGAGKAGLVFRFPADGLASSKMAAGQGMRFFLTTERGQVYGLSAEGSGQWLWRQSLGAPIYDSPILVGKRLYVRTVYGDLYCLNAEDGQPMWRAPATQVDAILGGTDRQLLVRSISAQTEAIDADSGSVVAEFHGVVPARGIGNPYTDRVYLITTSGSVQCLRPVDSELPKMLLAEFAPLQPATPAPEEGGAGEIQKPSTPFQPSGLEDEGGESPFEGGDDPFGGDPFGGGNDPFGGGEGNENPFGF